MALLKGKGRLFAGALFAGALFGPAEKTEATPQNYYGSGHPSLEEAREYRDRAIEARERRNLAIETAPIVEPAQIPVEPAIVADQPVSIAIPDLFAPAKQEEQQAISPDADNIGPNTDNQADIAWALEHAQDDEELALLLMLLEI